MVSHRVFVKVDVITLPGVGSTAGGGGVLMVTLELPSLLEGILSSIVVRFHQKSLPIATSLFATPCEIAIK
jgi:hypothetical protein